MLTSTSIMAQYTLKPGSVVEIDNATGDIAVLTDNENLQCGNQNNTGVIEYLECGFGTNEVNGECVVSAGEAFEIDYGLTEANSCLGLDGTSEWQGTHSIGSGTGDYSYLLNNGISQDTNFTLTCDNQPKTYKFNEIVYRGVIDLRNVLKSGIVLAQIDSKRFKIDLSENTVKTDSFNHRIEIESINEIQFMVRQLGTDLHILPKTNQFDISVDQPKKLFGENITTYMFITGDPPPLEHNHIPRGMAKGKCDSLSKENTSAINVVFDESQKGCYVDLKHQAYLIWYLLEEV